jgi:ring-1,2-phenylacetyl-CoA epoxidase subunit PaaC
MQRSVDDLWMYTGELFDADAVDREMTAAGIAPALASLREPWLATVREVFAEATLAVPGETYMQRGGKQGVHTEKLGFLLAEMQYLQRSYPDARW